MKPFILVSLLFNFVGCDQTNQPEKENHLDIKPNIKIEVVEKIKKITELKTTKLEPISEIEKEIKHEEPIMKTEKVVEVLIVEKPSIIVKKELREDKIISYPEIELVKQSSVATKKTINNFDFDIIKKGYKDNNTLLIVGGIQGDEPGGFMAASLIATHYNITKGSVWVVPNLNFYSIIKRSRGPYGDMNRKFANLPKSDPEYEIVQRIKTYITAPEVKLIVNLHDGSGFYRTKYEDKMHQPLKWGQSSVIDQDILPGVKKYANTFDISEQVVKHINKHLLKAEDKYQTKNTHTRFKKTNEEVEMAKTLTYYAVTHGKSAFGHETSKSLSVSERVYYKLLALEKYMDIMGIEYERKFKLKENIVKNILDNDIAISLYGGKINLPLSKIRNILNYFPIKKDGKIDFKPSNPLMSIVKKGNQYTIYYGNRRLARLNAKYIEHETINNDVRFKIDSDDKNIKFGSIVKVKKDFMVYPIKDYKINVVGYTDNKRRYKCCN